jgi:hypothetical protein
MKQRKFFYFGLSILFFLIYFKTSLYKFAFKYEQIGDRNLILANSDFKEKIDGLTVNFYPKNVEDIINKSLEITASDLEFDSKVKNKNPNVLILSNKAHCVGYSAYFATVFDYLLLKYRFKKNWLVKHSFAKIYFLNTNLNQYFQSPFFRDHDFNIIESKIDKRKYCIDASLYDCCKINIVKLK